MLTSSHSIVSGLIAEAGDKRRERKWIAIAAVFGLIALTIAISAVWPPRALRAPDAQTMIAE